MLKSKKITCIVTGKTTSYAGEFLAKKINEYGNEDNLLKYYVSKEVKALLKKGYKIKDIKKILDVEADIEGPPEEVIKVVEKEFSVNTENSYSQTLSTITELTYDRSDPDVENFINTFIIKRI